MLYTFGYEGLDVAAFIGRLQEAGVRAVVDVRELPLSRKRGFSKVAFGAALEVAGISYLHVAALGCPKPTRQRYRADRDWAVYTRSFLAYLRRQDAVVARLAQASKQITTCLVCFEANYTLCHRTFVARAVSQRGGPDVLHLTATGVIPDAVGQVAA